MNHRSYRERIYPRYTSERMPRSLAYGENDYRRLAIPILHRLKGWLPHDRAARCLDVACGAGEALYALGCKGYTDVRGIDISPEQVKTARKVCANVEEAEATAYLLSHTSAFDFILAFDIIEHFTKEELFPFLDALYSALKPGGTIVLQTPNAESPWGMMHRYHDLTHENAFDPFSLRHALSLSGFVDFEARGSGPYVHGPLSLIRWMLWRGIDAGLRLWNLAETGAIGSGVYTRVFLAKASKE